MSGAGPAPGDSPARPRAAARVAATAVALAVMLVVPVWVLDCARPPASANLAARAGLATENTVGLALQVVEGPIAEEGSTKPPDRRLLLGSPGGVLALDLGREAAIAALLVVAEHDDRYVVETSRDGLTWSAAWEVPAVAEPGMRRRHAKLPSPARARHLRVRAHEGAYGDASHLNALRVYETLPAGWPDALVEPISSFPWLGADAVDRTKVALGCLAALVLVLCLLAARSGASEPMRLGLRRLMIGVAVVGGLGWWNFLQLTDGEYLRAHRNYWDAYHYYMGSKYAAELGYTNFYRCMLAVDSEDGLRAVHATRRFTRDLTTNEFVPTRQIFAEAALCRDRFSDARWQAFRADQAWWRGQFLPSSWQLFPRDHGYNASPAWTLGGWVFASTIPLSDFGFTLLASLDTVLLVLMWAIVWSTFGWLASAAALVFFGTNLVVGNFFVSGAFLRHDWLFAAVVGVCCLKRERMAIAGFLLAYAALLRLFPAFLIGGLGLWALVDMARRRSRWPTPEQTRLAAGVIAGLVIVGGLSVAAGDRPNAWAEFVGNTSKHSQTPQIQAMGMRAALMHLDQPALRAKKRVPLEALIESYDRPGRAVLGIVLAALFLPVLALAVSGERAWVAAILGVLWLPFVQDISNYYWSLLLVFGLLIDEKPEVGYGFAAVLVTFALLGLAYPYTSVSPFTWGSLVLVLFFCWVAAVFVAPKLQALRAGRVGVTAA